MKAARGTSLVELLVVLALLSLMMLAAAQLVIHSIQLLGATGRSVRNPILVHVTNRLRNDVQEASGLTRVEDVWTEDPIELRTHTGGLVRIGVEEGRLMRRVVAPGGGDIEERVLLRGVVSWWWRSPVPGVVDLNISYLVYQEAEHHAAREIGYSLDRRNENLRFAIRGGGDGARW